MGLEVQGRLDEALRVYTQALTFMPPTAVAKPVSQPAASESPKTWQMERQVLESRPDITLKAQLLSSIGKVCTQLNQLDTALEVRLLVATAVLIPQIKVGRFEK